VQTKRRRPSRGWESLTPTELEVVGLVTEGLSNPDIAARMFVSRETVKSHLSNIFVKLGVTNRTELTAVASRRT
jgi:DNA-binding NarL/FixJ family response regulator